MLGKLLIILIFLVQYKGHTMKECVHISTNYFLAILELSKVMLYWDILQSKYVYIPKWTLVQSVSAHLGPCLKSHLSCANLFAAYSKCSAFFQSLWISLLGLSPCRLLHNFSHLRSLISFTNHKKCAVFDSLPMCAVLGSKYASTLDWQKETLINGWILKL